MEYWIWLAQLPYIGPVAVKALLQAYQSPRDIYLAKEEELIARHILDKRQLESRLNNRDLEKAKRTLDQCQRAGIQILTVTSPLYPPSLKVIPDNPALLYYRGQVMTTQKVVGIVGARRCNQVDKKKVIQTTTEYTSMGYAVVSGMAKGVDSYAHTQCLKAGGYTIAVLGNGLDICYPKEHLKLMEAISQEGLLLSEYPPQTPPKAYNFPRRNRIISALADELVVIAAGKGSGTETTRQYAIKYGKKVVNSDGERQIY